MAHISAGRRGPRRRIPVHAGVLSLACLGIPIAASALWGGELGQYELLLWVSALLPPFLLAYYRGWSGAAVALAAGMAALSVAHAGVMWGTGAPLTWWIPVVVSIPLILVSLGAGWLSELLWKKVLLAERNAAELSLVVEPSARILFASPSVERFLGYAPALVEGRPLSDLVESADDARALMNLLTRDSAGAEPIEVCFRHAGGEPRTLELVAGGAARSGEHGLIVIVARDITSRRALEEQHRRVHTMRVVSSIVGGVAHDTNNLVTALNGHIHALHETLPPPVLRRLEVSALKARGERVGALMRQLVGFTRQSDLRVQPVFLNGFIQQRMSLFQKLLPEGVHLNVAFGDDGGFLSVDPVGLTEAVTSILSNAAEATRTGDDVSIRTYRDAIEEQRSGSYSYPVRTGDYLVIEIEDTGTGMPDEVLSRALEPFFTTRPTSRSLGLGLSAAYGFIKQSGGYFWLSSTPGKGTTAKIYLPEEPDRTADLDDGVPAAVAGSAHRFLTVLTVEDEPLVLSYMRSVLLREGYIVLEASDGREALEQFGNASIDILVADLGLPNVRGDDLLRHLRMNRPMLPAVLTSGFTHSELLDDSFFDAPTELLAKPFSPPELLAALERVHLVAAAGADAGAPVGV
jgi:two-component system, cell cycle sensor histidine kinase and response regulator CckA